MRENHGSWMKERSGSHLIQMSELLLEAMIFSTVRLPALSVLEPGKLIMEVKFTEMLPQILRNLLPPQAAEFTAVSKYVLCYEKTRYMNGFEYWYDTQGRMIR